MRADPGEQPETDQRPVISGIESGRSLGGGTDAADTTGSSPFTAAGYVLSFVLATL